MANSIGSYIKQAYHIFDIPSFLVLRYARTRPLSGNQIFTRILSAFYKSLSLRSKAFRGLKLIIDPANFSHIKITDEFFFENVYDLSNISFAPDCVVDCGAHIGMFSILCKSRFRQVPLFLFEPNPSNLVFINQQVKANSFSHFTIESSAVSTYDGEATFENSDVSFGGFLSTSKPKDSFITVKVTNLCEYIKGVVSQRLLIKIDIEGEEENLIPALIQSLPKQCAMFLEYHFGSDKFKNFQYVLENNGFSVKINRIVDNKYIDAFALRL